MGIYFHGEKELVYVDDQLNFTFLCIKTHIHGMLSRKLEFQSQLFYSVQNLVWDNEKLDLTRRSRIYTWYPNQPVNIICSELHISNLWNALLIQCKPLSLVNQYWEIIQGVRVLIRVPFNLLIVLRFHIKCPISNSEVDPLFWYRQNWKLLEWERYANRRQNIIFIKLLI